MIGDRLYTGMVSVADGLALGILTDEVVGPVQGAIAFRSGLVTTRAADLSSVVTVVPASSNETPTGGE